MPDLDPLIRLRLLFDARDIIQTAARLPVEVSVNPSRDGLSNILTDLNTSIFKFTERLRLTCPDLAPVAASAPQPASTSNTTISPSPSPTRPADPPATPDSSITSPPTSPTSSPISQE